MAALASSAKFRVLAGQGETGFFLVVEGLPVERPEIDVLPLVLDVADLAIAAHFAVDALLDFDPLGHCGVAGEALVRADLFSGRVASLAIVRALQAGVSSGQRSRRSLGPSSDGEDPEEHEENQ
jgi:hypothetical protein